jgi:hypothetical protein
MNVFGIAEVATVMIDPESKISLYTAYFTFEKAKKRSALFLQD